MVPLDSPMVEEDEKQPELNKPKAGGPKKYYVYVKDPSSGNIKKVSWGDTTGLKIKLNDPEARKSFAARHKCSTKNDKTKPGYWACRMPYFAKQLGLSEWRWKLLLVKPYTNTYNEDGSFVRVFDKDVDPAGTGVA